MHLREGGPQGPSHDGTGDPHRRGRTEGVKDSRADHAAKLASSPAPVLPHPGVSKKLRTAHLPNSFLAAAS